LLLAFYFVYKSCEVNKMQNYTFLEDVKVLCVQATSFPEGIVDAHKNLHSLIPPSQNRRYFGISYLNNEGQKIYYAAAEELIQGEAEKFALDTFNITKGEYLSVRINNFQKDISSIAKTFQELLSDLRTNPDSVRLEMFLNETDILCMMKIK
jgi:predicted transcriptional regulator YdeE